jgi:hypothetical protein
MTCKLMAGDTVLHELEYYSVGGGFIEWKGYTPPKKGQPKYPYATMKELQAHATKNKLSVAQVAMANEMAVSGKSQAEIEAFIDKITTAMVNIVKAGLKAPAGTLPGPIKLKTKAGDVYQRAMDDQYEKQRGVGVVAAYALAGSEENARGHLVVTAPTGGSAGVMPALVYVVGEGGRNLRRRRSATACCPQPRSAICASTMRRCRAPRAAVRPRSASRRRWAPRSSRRRTTSDRRSSRTPPSRRSSTTSDDLRSGRGIRPDPVRRALRVRGREVVDRLHDREQRDPGQPARRLSTPPSRRWRSPPRR